MLDETWLLNRFCFWIPLVLSLTVHEWAHAWTASVLGDTTAKDEGRVSLNPLVHIDPIGTLILPLIGVPLGWAKPVPVNVARFYPQVGMRSGVLLTSAAGPASNLLIAMVSIIILVIVEFRGGDPDQILRRLLHTLVWLNVLLASFNLLPLTPLDGSRIADALMPDRFRPEWDAFASLGPLPLILVCLLPLFAGFNPFCWTLFETQAAVQHVVQLMSR